jgi:hypothetical protein
MLSNCSKIIHYKQSLIEIYFELVRYKNKSDYFILFDRISNLLKMLKTDIDINKNECQSESEHQSIKNTPLYYLTLLYKLIAQTRDFQHGKGERTITYVMIYAWYAHYPLFSIFALKKMVYYGCWKDLNYFCEYIYDATQNQDHPLICESIAYINKQLHKDMNTSNISYVAKWIPRENSKFGWIFNKLVCNWFNLNDISTFDSSYYYGEYRKIIANLNRKLMTIEIDMCSNNWQNIEFQTLFKYQNVLLNVNRKNDIRPKFHNSVDRNICSKRFKKNIDFYLQGINVDHVFNAHYEVGFYVKEAFAILDNSNIFNIDVTNMKMGVLNKKWQSIISNVKNVYYGYSIPMVDVSSHMSDGNSMALFNAIGFACLIAEKSLIGKRILLMDYEPKWVILDSSLDFMSMISLIRASYMGNMTFDFESSMKMIMDTMCNSQISNNTISKIKIILFSNLFSENDRIQKYNIFETFSELKEYPQLIYWNLSDKILVDREYPCKYDNKSCMLSGTQVHNMNVLELKYLYAFDTVEYILTNPNYNCMSEYILGILH